MNELHHDVGAARVLDLRRVDEVCFAFEDAWRDGQRPRLEDFLAPVDAPERSECLRRLLLLELECRGEQGEDPLPDEYAARFPGDLDLLDLVFRRLAPS